MFAIQCEDGTFFAGFSERSQALWSLSIIRVFEYLQDAKHMVYYSLGKEEREQVKIVKITITETE